MELTKYGGSEIFAHIKHDLRQLPHGKSYGNESVDSSLSYKNYSLIDRGKTAKEVNQYRKDFESKIFKYNRKNLVHAVELVIQCPSDCPPEQHEAFFQTAFDWYCDSYLVAGKSSVFVAEVHVDEHKIIKTECGLKDISKEHLHIAYVPAIPAGPKHPDYEYRLNADALTKRAILRDMHPSLQTALDKAGIKATVYRKKSDAGKTVPLTVAQLKEITDKTGVVIDHTLTVDELANVLAKNVELHREVNVLTAANADQKNHILCLNNKVAEKDQELSHFAGENQNLQEHVKALQDTLKVKELELQQERKNVKELEAQKSTLSATPQEPTWGTNSEWGSASGWGNKVNKERTLEEDVTL